MAALASRGSGMPPLWPLLAQTAGQPFRARVSGPGQSQGGRWAGSLGFGLREGPWGAGCCGRRQARQRLPQSEGSGSLSSAVILPGSVAHWWAGSLEPGQEVINLGEV